MRVKQRKGRPVKDKKKVYNMCQRNRVDIDFEAERTEDHTFSIKQSE